MGKEVTNYQCPSCTAPLHYGEKSGQLECDYCGCTYDVAEIESLYAEKEAEAAEVQTEAEESQESVWDTDSAGGDWGEEAAQMRVYSCPSCGAQLFCDETTAATSCPYCGNPSVIPGVFEGTRKPDLVLPFQLTKEQAVKALQQHYQKKTLLPKAFKEHNHIQEIKGVYVPFWLFDNEAQVDMTYAGTNSTTRREGDYRVTRTRHFVVYRAGHIGFEKVPVDGSSKMPDDFMDSIEPYDYRALKEFSTAYLPGFLADKYDVDAKEAAARAETRCRQTAEEQTRRTVIGYETVTPLQSRVQLHGGSVRYALLPVWMLSTRWNGKNYLFAMNGQTGKLVGDLPMDRNKGLGIFLGTAAAASILCLLFLSGPLGQLITRLFFT